LIKAFRRVRERHPDARLTLLGRVPDLGDIPGVTVVGRVPLDQLPSYYADASVFCMPTRLEPFGNVFVEAMWQQLPIVATRVGALPDIVKDGVNGFLVAPDDDGALAERLCTLLDDPALCATFGTAARSRAEERYDWPLVAGRIRDRIEKEIAA
jgi:glycosyltransferase involved in cell wall biosynthesis